MGKRIIAQRRGRGTHTYKAPSHRYIVDVRYKPVKGKTVKGVVKNIIHDPARNAPIAEIEFDDFTDYLLVPEGTTVGDTIEYGDGATVKPGNILPLKKIPEGTLIFNIEARPEDGGKFARSSGMYGIVISHDAKKTIISLPSKKMKELNPECKATIGIIAGGERKIKPFVKAGTRHYAMKTRGRLYPRISAGAMNVVDHKFGGSHLGVHKSVSRNAPPGRKVGSISPKRMGRKKR